MQQQNASTRRAQNYATVAFSISGSVACVYWDCHRTHYKEPLRFANIAMVKSNHSVDFHKDLTSNPVNKQTDFKQTRVKTQPHWHSKLIYKTWTLA